MLRVQHVAAPMPEGEERTLWVTCVVGFRQTWQILHDHGFPMKCAINCSRHLLKQNNMGNMFFCPHHICTTCPCADSQFQPACSAACFYVRVVFNYSDKLKNIETLEFNNTDEVVKAPPKGLHQIPFAAPVENQLSTTHAQVPS